MKQLKFGLLLLFFFLVIINVIPAAAHAAEGDTGTDGDFSWRELAGGSVAVTGYSGSDTSITIPDTLNGMPVTAIGNGAFQNDTSVTEVNMPATVTAIGSWAFAHCTSLTTAALPGAVTSIGEYAFYNCPITSVNLHSGLSIGSSAFELCSALTSLTIPSGVTMGFSVFNRCTMLSSLTIAADCTSLGVGHTFNGCTALTSVEIPGGITALPNSLFTGCTNLSAVVLQNGVQTIGDQAFYNCSNLSSLTLPTTLKSIGYQSFYSCSKLATVTLPVGFETIGQSAFISCSSLTSINIPEGVTSIGNNAFQATGLVSVDLPDSLTTMGTFLFALCTNLESIDYPAGITTIPVGMFWRCTALDNPPIPSTVTTIDISAFRQCSFEDITIPAHVTSIGNYVFMQCTNLEKATILNASAVFGTYVFEGTALASDGLYSYAGSTTQTYASANSHPFHAFCTVSFDSGGGSAVANIETASNLMLSRPADPVLAGQMLEGWYKDADFTDRWDFAADLIPGDMTLYANWEPVSISGLPGALTTYEGARTTLNPQPAGGAWDWDRSFFSATFNSPATFTALKTGTSVIRYTVYGVSTDITVTVREAALPVTGQSTTWIWVFSLLAIASLGIGIVMKCIKTKEKISG